MHSRAISSQELLLLAAACVEVNIAGPTVSTLLLTILLLPLSPQAVSVGSGPKAIPNLPPEAVSSRLLS